MLTAKRTGKLSYEILGLVAACIVLAAVVFGLLWVCGRAMAESFLAAADMDLTESQGLRLDSWILQLSLLASVCFFVVLFLFLLGERLAYIRRIIAGIDALREDHFQEPVPLEGNNELTRLAEAVNYLHTTRKQVRRKEQRLREEREQLIRSLSHDIRTPLTAVLSLSQLLAAQAEGEQKQHLQTICKKAEQIRDLSAVLLDGGHRQPEYFQDARLLMEQLMEEFREQLEEGFTVHTQLLGGAFEGNFDIGELRRIFDNLGSNVQKYADPSVPVVLEISPENSALVIRQSNGIRRAVEAADSYRMGLRSMQRIAQNYGGSVETRQEAESFEITVTLEEIL